MNVLVTVEYFGMIRSHVADARERLEVAAGHSVASLLELLVRHHGPVFRDQLLAPRGEPLPNVVLTVDGRRIADRAGMDAVIDKDVVVTVLQMPPFTGGG